MTRKTKIYKINYNKKKKKKKKKKRTPPLNVKTEEFKTNEQKEMSIKKKQTNKQNDLGLINK